MPNVAGGTDILQAYVCGFGASLITVVYAMLQDILSSLASAYAVSDCHKLPTELRAGSTGYSSAT